MTTAIGLALAALIISAKPVPAKDWSPPRCTELQQNQFMMQTLGVHEESVLTIMRENFEAVQACDLGDSQ